MSNTLTLKHPPRSLAARSVSSQRPYPWAYGPWDAADRRHKPAGMREAIARVWFLAQSDVQQLYNRLKRRTNDPVAATSSLDHAIVLRIEDPEHWKTLTALMGLDR